MMKRRWIATLIALALLAVTWIAGVQSAAAQSRDMLVERYTPLAGSADNSAKLVDGLRNGADFTLGTTRFDPPTGKLGNGEVNNALALASASLKGQGITSPTPQQLQSTLQGILAQRADHKGWGQIAQSLGFKLGEVVRNPKAEHSERMANAGKPERPQHADRPERPERPEKPEKPERPERAGR